MSTASPNDRNRRQRFLPNSPHWDDAVATVRSRTGWSRRTVEIGLCYRAGLSRARAAAAIGCSEASVSEHTRRLYLRMHDRGVTNQASFAAYVEWALSGARPDDPEPGPG